MNYILSSRSCALRSHVECDREHSVKSERRSSAKGKLKLAKITFFNRHFLVKEKVVAGETMLFLFNARKTSFITTLFLKCTTAAVCRQIMLPKTIRYLLQSNRGIVVKCNPKKKA